MPKERRQDEAGPSGRETAPPRETRQSPASTDAFLQAIARLEARMGERMDSLKRELSQERAEADEKLVKRMKMEKLPSFKKKSHEKQYKFNEDVRSTLATVKTALEETPPVVEKALEAVEEGEQLIKERQKFIRIADRSEHGWATVEEYADDELADDSDDEKRLLKAEARAGRKMRQKYTAKGPKGRRISSFKRPGFGAWQKLPFNSSHVGGAQESSATIGSQLPPASSAGMASVMQRMSGSLPCFYCGKAGHFKKNCPLWNNLQAQATNNVTK